LTYFNKFASCCCFCMAFPLSSTDGMSNDNIPGGQGKPRRVFFFRLSIYSFNKTTIFLSSSCIYRVLNYASKHYPGETGVMGTSPTSHMMDLSSEIWPEGPSGCGLTMWINYLSARERGRSRVERQSRRETFHIPPSVSGYFWPATNLQSKQKHVAGLQKHSPLCQTRLLLV